MTTGHGADAVLVDDPLPEGEGAAVAQLGRVNVALKWPAAATATTNASAARVVRCSLAAEERALHGHRRGRRPVANAPLLPLLQRSH